MENLIYDTKDKVLEYIEKNQLKNQDRLPSEAALVQKLGITRSSLRKVFDSLEKQGSIWRHVGRGTFIGSRPLSSNKDVEDVINKTNPSELMQARLIFEPELASIAAINATLSEFSQMKLYLDQLENITDITIYENCDSLFHQSIAEATHNSLLISIFKVISNVRKSDFWGRIKEVTVTPEYRNLYCQQHNKILDSLMNREPNTSKKLMREHLESVSTHISQAIKQL